jgi:hypothetical protein
MGGNMLTTKSLRLSALSCGLILAGCAPSFGPGVQMGLGPTSGLEIANASCSLSGGQNSALPFTRLSTSASAFGVMQKINAIQAKYTMGMQDVRAQSEGWKRLAKGEC